MPNQKQIKLNVASSVGLTGALTSKLQTVALTATLRKIDRALPDGSPMFIRLEDVSQSVHLGGEFELAQELISIRSRREIFAHFQDHAIGSIAVVTASLANRRTANQAAILGAFGDIAVLRDSSGLAKSEEIKINVVRAGAWKGVGTPGTAISPDQVAELGKPVIESTLMILETLQAVRKWNADQLNEILSGKMFLGAELVALGLIDRVASSEQAFSEFSNSLRSKNNALRWSKDFP